MPETLQSARLTLRRWKHEDRAAFAALNADPRVMEFYPAPLTRTQSDAMADGIEAHFEEHGFGLWAAELKAKSEFIGFIGLHVPSYPLPFSPCVEVGWRLAFAHWGKGYAPEGARVVLDHGFEYLDLSEIVSFTATVNARSRRVMEKIGMTRDPKDDFLHPRLSGDHPLAPHVLYRIERHSVSLRPD